MKQLDQLTIAGLLLTCGIPASAQVAQLVTLDENGNGSIQISGVPISAVPFVTKSDPFVPTGPTNVLTYLLPFNTVPGDVELTDPTVTGGQDISDVLRFPGNSTVLFYSSIINGDPKVALADIGLPSVISSLPIASVAETGIEETNTSAFYVPGVGQPGFDINPNGLPTNYLFISDSPVPEASNTLSLGLLLALGVGGLIVARRKGAPRA